ncbi:DUF349 domain-containing protein [uncultured Acetobacteroides sp.]|uniref:DUF349 domain-containing protein n=1 Tax=uncultured Acetobacteroides sp. TaxID=1760811 RepID=UPI0029F4734A|nr:DUF349 domain-containing protein [uncultured Acetobacteroides sp.]
MESEKNDALVPEEQLNKSVEDTVDATPAANIEVVEEGNETSPAVDFSEEEAMLAAEEIDLGEEEETEDAAHPVVDYSGHSLQELVAALEAIVTNSSESPRREIEAIKIAFYKRLRVDVEAKKADFLKAGGEETEFKAPECPEEQTLKDLIMAYRNAKHLKGKEIEAEKENNYKEKLQILEELKVLSEGAEAHNHTYQEFRSLQNRWKEIGQVPQAHVKDLWDNYHYLVEKFYDYIKINRELRDLDLKKNYENKILLCEKAEELLLEPSAILSFQKLQKLHEQWREVGPVVKEFKETLWERFKEATSKINKKHQEYYDLQKEDQKKNLDAKTLLCEKAEELLENDPKSTKDWNKRSKDLIELQKVWKTIGFAPKKENPKIYQRFREACDAFFAKKREFYMQLKGQIEVNLQAKLELCAKAEEISASTDWKKATDELIALQKQWKEVGPVPRKHSDEVWKRFRAACDSFFNRKSEHFSGIDKLYEENLTAKEALIEEIKAFESSEDVMGSFEALKEFQRRWAEIGFVPMKDKERIQSTYREVIDAQFQKIKGTDAERKIGKFKGWVESNTGRGDKKFRAERDKLIGKIRQLESDISVWENNIGFFAKSKNADTMIKDVKNKINKAKEEITLIEEKINLIDSQLPE